MKTFWNITITILLVALIALVLFKNKRSSDLQIAFAEREVEAIPVRAVRISEGTIQRELIFKDVIKPVKELRINAPVQGRIIKIYTNEGKSVQVNDLLIKTDDYYVKAEYEIDKQNYELAQRNLNRVESLNKENALPKNQYEQIATQVHSAEIKMAITEKKLNETWVRSPVSGFVNQLFVKEGMLINPSVPIGEVVDLSAFVITLYVSESEVVHLHQGMEAGIVVGASSTINFPGEIKYVAINADFALKYKVIVQFKNDTDWLKGGMACTVRINLQDDSPGMLIPASAVIKGVDENFLFIVENNVAYQKPIAIIASDNEFIKASGEVKAGDMVILEGMSKIRDNSKVRIVETVEE